ncbi:MAG TPA: CHASE2 domain-containing protein [Verrucomicrobiales bacterium]|jgi:hypothetical protein|nr:CHASE2 domain-containing protein [Verrucomicrobiales bacterium]
MIVRNSLLVLLFGGVLGGFCLREQQRGTLDGFDKKHREFLKANVSSGGPVNSMETAAVVFARVDDKDQSKRVFETWPLGEGDWQIILQNLPGYTPRAVALGVPLRFSKAGAGLETSAKAIPGLVVAVEASTAAGDGPQALPDSVPVLKVNGSPARIPEFKSIKPSPVAGAAAPVEIDLVSRDRKISVDGDWCRVPLLARQGDKVVPMLALRVLLEWAKVSPKDVTVRPGFQITDGKDLHIPIDDGGFFRYFLSLAPEVPAVNADDFVLARDQTLEELPTDDPRRGALLALKERILWFGEDNVAARTLKKPNGTPVSPAELTAGAIAAIQTDSYMRPLAPDFQWVPVAATLFFCLWLTHWRKSRLLPGAFVVAVALVGVSLHLYRQDHQWMPIGPSLAVLGATVVISFLLPSRTGRETEEATPPATRRTAKTKPIEPAAASTQSRQGTAKVPDTMKETAALVSTVDLAMPEELEIPGDSETPPAALEPNPWEEADTTPAKNAQNGTRGKKKRP